MSVAERRGQAAGDGTRQGHQRPEAERSPAHHVGQKAKQHGDVRLQVGAWEHAPAKHHHHHDERQYEGRVRRKSPRYRGRQHRKQHREDWQGRIHGWACAMPSPGLRSAAAPVCSRRFLTGSMAALGAETASGVRLSSGIAESARSTETAGGSVLVKVGVSKNSTLTTSSELSSAYGRTLKAPSAPVTTPTRRPRGSTPSPPE